MNRHLLPEEFDLLVDGEAGVEAGFGLAPLRAHVRACDACAAELDAAREVVSELDALPRLSASPAFANAVMAQVQIFVPWHVTLTDTMRGWVPQSRPLRALAGVGALGAGTVLTLVLLWLAARIDLIAFSTDAASLQLRDLVTSSGRVAMGALFGPAATHASPMVALMTVAAFVVALLGATAGLRAVATASRAAGDR